MQSFFVLVAFTVIKTRFSSFQIVAVVVVGLEAVVVEDIRPVVNHVGFLRGKETLRFSNGLRSFVCNL